MPVLFKILHSGVSAKILPYLPSGFIPDLPRSGVGTKYREKVVRPRGCPSYLDYDLRDSTVFMTTFLKK